MWTACPSDYPDHPERPVRLADCGVCIGGLRGWRFAGLAVIHLFAIEDGQSSNCLNAGAKLGTHPRVGAERLADVRN